VIHYRPAARIQRRQLILVRVAQTLRLAIAGFRIHQPPAAVGIGERRSETSSGFAISLRGSQRPGSAAATNPKFFTLADD
jgi:hypothetical protein